MTRIDYPTRRNFHPGIQWNGYLYEAAPGLTTTGRVMVLEDHRDYLLVSDYTKHVSWSEPSKPCGVPVRVNRIGLGRPTKEQIKRLQTAVKELQEPSNK